MLLVFAGLGLRYLRKREVEAFLDADMVDFQTFASKAKHEQAADPLMARAEAYAALNPALVTLNKAETSSDDDIDPVMLPDPHLYRLKLQSFDEITRNLLRLLSSLLPQGFVVLPNVPLSEFVQTEDAGAGLKLAGYRIGFLICESSDLTVVCGVQLRDAATGAQGVDFIKTVFGDIGKPLLEFPVSNDISELEVRDQLDPVLQSRERRSCPRCGEQMAIRRARKGKRAGETFWVCARFPDCRGVISV